MLLSILKPYFSFYTLRVGSSFLLTVVCIVIFLFLASDRVGTFVKMARLDIFIAYETMSTAFVFSGVKETGGQ